MPSPTTCAGFVGFCAFNLCESQCKSTYMGYRLDFEESELDIVFSVSDSGADFTNITFLRLSLNQSQT